MAEKLNEALENTETNEAVGASSKKFDEIIANRENLLEKIEANDALLENLFAKKKINNKDKSTYLALQKAVEKMKQEIKDVTDQYIESSKELEALKTENERLKVAAQVAETVKREATVENAKLAKLKQEREALEKQFGQLKLDTKTVEGLVEQIERQVQELKQKEEAQEKEVTQLRAERNELNHRFNSLNQGFLDEKVEIADLFIGLKSKKAQLSQENPQVASEDVEPKEEVKEATDLETPVSVESDTPKED